MNHQPSPASANRQLIAGERNANHLRARPAFQTGSLVPPPAPKPSYPKIKLNFSVLLQDEEDLSDWQAARPCEMSQPVREQGPPCLSLANLLALDAEACSQRQPQMSPLSSLSQDEFSLDLSAFRQDLE